jgi:hypothetical protein
MTLKSARGHLAYLNRGGELEIEQTTASAWRMS